MRLSGYLIFRYDGDKLSGFCAYTEVNEVMRELRSDFFYKHQMKTLELDDRDAAIMLTGAGTMEVPVPGTDTKYHVRRFN